MERNRTGLFLVFDQLGDVVCERDKKKRIRRRKSQTPRILLSVTVMHASMTGKRTTMDPTSYHSTHGIILIASPDAWRLTITGPSEKETDEYVFLFFLFLFVLMFEKICFIGYLRKGDKKKKKKKKSDWLTRRLLVVTSTPFTLSDVQLSILTYDGRTS